MNGLPSLDQESGRLTIAFAPDKSFQVSSISDEGPTIAEAAAKILGRPIKVDLVLGDRGQREETKEEIRQEVAPTHQEELLRACDKDEALGELVDMIGGTPLPESDRDRWVPTDPE